MAQLENEIGDSKLFESILTQPANVKQITMAKGVKRSYNRKSKVNDKAKKLMEQMMNEENEKENVITSEIVNEVINLPISETISEPIIEQTNKEKHEKIIHDLINSEGDMETRLAKQQEAYRLEKQWRQEDEQEQKQKNKEEFDKRANEVISELTNEEDKMRIAAKIACLKLIQKERENQMSEYEQFSKMISDAFDVCREQIQSKTIKQRIDGAIVDLYEYRKFADDKLKNKLLTGHAIGLCLCKDNDLCIIDFDIDHTCKLNEQEKGKIRQNIINNMLPTNIGLVLTARGGIHAYCNRNGYKLPSNKNEKVVTYDDDLEIDIFAQMYTHKDGKLVENRVVIPNSKVRIMDKGVQKKEILHYKELNDWSNATHLASLYDILGNQNLDLTAKDKDFSIINDDCTIHTMPKEIVDACIDGLKRLSIHNDTNTLEREISLLPLFMGLNGLQHLGEQYKEASYSAVQMNNNLTAKASEHWNDRKAHYYDQTLKPLIIKTYESKKQQKIETVVKSIEKNEIDLIDPFTLKDISSKTLNGKYKNKLELVAQDLQKIIRMIPCQNGLCYIIKEYNCFIAKNVINYKSKSAIYDQLRSIRLWADRKKHITVIDALKQYHSLFEKLGIKFISDNQEIFSVFQGFKYTQLDEMNQTKIEQFLALIKDTIPANDERVGIFIQNITDIDDFVGKFNTAIENKMLAIANEMKNFGDSRISNMDALKSIITEDSFVINEKYLLKHEVQNVVNIMIATNNIYPLTIENSDRRYVVCQCNPVHRGDLKDISQFNPRDIPMTQAKKDLIKASITPVDDVTQSILT
ncbi:MAG: hypothetical protein EZS28_022183, partial [Streblomastix strix]